jgi:hypothetical protein
MNVINALNKANIQTFNNRYYSSPKLIAQDSLSRITHYVDDSTLRYFKAKILKAKPVFDGALFMILESSSMDMNNTKRGFRCVVFDVFGESIYRASLEEMYPTSKAAMSAYQEWTNSFDLDAYYTNKIAREVSNHKKQAERLEEALA